MQLAALIYVPTDTPASMAVSTQRVCGVPLIVRSIMNAMNSGISCCTLLIAPSQKQKIEKFLRRFRSERTPEINYINYDEPYGITPRIVQEILDSGLKQYLVLNSNLLIEPSTIKKIINLPVNSNQIIKSKQGIVDIPAILLPASKIQSLQEFTFNKPRSIENCINHIVESSENKIFYLETKENAYLVTRSQDRTVAETFLAESIRLSTSAPVAKVLNKRISLPISLVLSRLWVSPHAITVFNIIVGLLSGVFLAGGNYKDMLIGALLYKAASVLDGCDGEVAKLTFRASKFGQYMDTISDNLSLASFLIGLAIGLHRMTSNMWPIYICIWTIIAAIGSIMIIAQYLKKHTKSASLATFDTGYLRLIERKKTFLTRFISVMKYFVKKDVFTMIALVFAIFGWFKLILLTISFGATLALITLIILQFKNISVPATNIAEDKKAAQCRN